MSSLFVHFLSLLHACAAGVLRAGRGPVAVWSSARPVAAGSVRVGQLAVGIAGIGAGVGLMLASGLGVGAWDAFHAGLAEAVSVPLSAVIAVTGLAILAGGVALGGRPRWGTIAPLLVGPVVEVTMRAVPAPHGAAHAWLLLAAGVLTVAAGAGAYLTAGCGMGPFDLVFYGLHRRGMPMTAARLSVDGCALLVATLVGGPVGVGTVAATVALGVLIPATVSVFERHAPVPRLAARGVLWPQPAS